MKHLDSRSRLRVTCRWRWTRRSRLAFLILLLPVPVWAQGLTCRALPGGAALPVLGQAEAWPALADELFLGRDVRAGLLSDGSAVVIDRAKSELIRVDRKTGRIATLARKGQGPGEIGAILGLVVTAGDTIAVVDLANRRLTRLNPQGGIVSLAPYLPAGLPVYLGATGRDVIEVSRSLPQRGKAEPLSMAIRLLGPESTTVLRTVELRDPASEPGLFSPTGFAALLDASHLVLASGVVPDVSVASLRASADSVIHLDLGAPERLTREIAAHVLSDALPQIPKESRPGMIATMLASVPMATFYPMFSRLFVSSSGHLWVQRTYPAASAANEPGAPATLSMDNFGGYLWQQFGHTGVASAECRAPTDWRVLGLGRGWILFARDDATNTQLFTWRPR